MQARLTYSTFSAYVTPMDEPTFTQFAVELEVGPDWPADADIEAGILRMTELTLTVSLASEIDGIRLYSAS